MNKTIISLVILACLGMSCGPLPAAADVPAGIDLQNCPLPFGGDQQISARCGTLTVSENPAEPSGRQIALNIVVIPAIKRTPAPDPLFLLAGGPGQSAVESFPVLLPAFFNVHQSRDIVLVDQRGTGKSNPLRCLTEVDETLDEAAWLEKLKSCPATLNADLRFYTTEIAMADLDAVCAALGYEQINLYGASYGTRAALTYLRMYPERVRSVILDAVVDPSFLLLLDAARDGQSALDQFFTRCQADAACKGAYPNLKDEFDQLLARLAQAPVDISIRHPITSAPLGLTLTRDLLLSLVFNTLYAPDLSATLPLSIHTAFGEGNYAPLVSLAYMLDAGLYDGMFYAVACTEDAPLIDAGEAARRGEGSVFGDRTGNFLSVCAGWPRGDVSPAFRATLTSNVPVLLLSGEADPITPPRHAEKLLPGLPNSLHLVFDDMAHGNIANRCAAGVVRDFIDTALVTGLDTTCVAGIRPAPFFINFSGPRP